MASAQLAAELADLEEAQRAVAEGAAETGRQLQRQSTDLEQLRASSSQEATEMAERLGGLERELAAARAEAEMRTELLSATIEQRRDADEKSAATIQVTAV